MKHLRTLVASLLVLGLLIGLGGWVLGSETDVLFRAQELSLWLPSRHFYDTSTIYPGGTLTWMAAYMTQYFYTDAGVWLLVGAWCLIAIQLVHAYRLRGTRVLLSVLVPLALAAIFLQTGYWIYYLKLQGHLWVPTLGVMTALLAANVHRLLPRWWGFAWYVLYGVVAYPLFGAWGGLGLLLMALQLDKAKTNPKIINIAMAPLFVVCVSLLPIIYCQWFFHQVEHTCIYKAALPCYQLGTIDCTQQYHWAYYVLLAAFVPAVVGGYWNKGRELLVGVLGLLLVAGGVLWADNRWYRDTNFYKEVAMYRCIENLDWEGVLRVMRSHDYGETKPPTRVMVMEKNLALFRLGRAGDEMFHYPEGAERQNAPWEVRLTQVGGKMLYYHYGKEQFCYRWCMEDGVEFGWTVDGLKYMTKSSLITHDWKVARKYIDMLKTTRFHREWAKKYEQLIGHPELMAQDEEMKPIIPMAAYPDRLDGDMTLVEMYLLKAFANGVGAEPYYQEMTLICSLIMKDIDLFWPRFHGYINMHRNDKEMRVPTHYQEAAYLYSMLEPQRPSEMWPGLTNAEAAERIPFDEGVKQKYKDFMNFNTQCGSMSEEQKKVAFAPMYGDTFYYFYFLVRNQKTN
ncbi:MAG: hypothetical protein HUK02_02515 [Bacteroidaceae bacterium]|nr:hypothetical protein [Bacteroidaceae bacterium]